MTELVRDVVVAGALVRRYLRRILDANRIQFIERKSLLDSDFVIDATPSEWAGIRAWIRRVNDTTGDQ